MKIIALSNTSWPHTGGHEKSLQSIADWTVKNTNHQFIILSNIAKCVMRRNGTLINPLPINAADFLQCLSKHNPDHIIVFSDQFKHWKTLIDNVEVIPGTKSIIPYGFPVTSDTAIKNAFLKKQNKFTVICRGSGDADFRFCLKNDIVPKIIPEFVNMEEFSNPTGGFRKLHNITTKYILLCISDFLPYKAQSHLQVVLNQLYIKRKDFTAIFISSSPHQVSSDKLCAEFILQMKRCNFPYRILIDLPNQDIVNSLYESDLFLLPSQREHHPLCILEAMTCQLPWVMLPTGDSQILAGGVTISCNKDNKGFCQYDTLVYDRFVETIDELLDNEKLREKLGSEGKQEVFEKYDIKLIVPQYLSVFEKK